METPSDQTLIAQYLAGHADAAEALVRRHQPRLYRSMAALLNSPEDAQDVCQEAFISAIGKLASFRGESHFYSWLFRIAYNAAISHRRKMRGSAASLDAQFENTGYEPADMNALTPPDAAMVSRESQQMVQQALAELPEEYRTALVLREFDGFRYEEIAELVSCPVGTVRSRIHRARDELRQKLARLLNLGLSEEAWVQAAAAGNSGV